MNIKVLSQKDTAILKKFDHTCGAYFESDGAQIYYEVAGNAKGPALVLLHGGMGTW